MRIALGGITHEANTFCPHVTDLADFEARQLLRGDEILRDWRTTRTEQAGALLENDGFQVTYPELIPVNDAGISYGQSIEYAAVHGHPTDTGS